MDNLVIVAIHSEVESQNSGWEAVQLFCAKEGDEQFVIMNFLLRIKLENFSQAQYWLVPRSRFEHTCIPCQS